MIQWKGFTATTQDEADAVTRFFDLTLAKEYGWTQTDILHRTTQDFYNDAILLMQKEAFFRQKEAEKKKNNK